MSNRVASISESYRSSADEGQVEWFFVGVLVILAIVLAGYLVQRHLDRERTAKYKHRGKD